MTKAGESVSGLTQKKNLWTWRENQNLVRASCMHRLHLRPYDSNTCQGQLKKRKIYFGSWMQFSIHPNREGTVAGVASSVTAVLAVVLFTWQGPESRAHIMFRLHLSTGLLISPGLPLQKVQQLPQYDQPTLLVGVQTCCTAPESLLSNLSSNLLYGTLTPTGFSACLKFPSIFFQRIPVLEFRGYQSTQNPGWSPNKIFNLNTLRKSLILTGSWYHGLSKTVGNIH